MWKTLREAFRDPTFSSGREYSQFTFRIDERADHIELELLPQIEDDAYKTTFIVKQGDQQAAFRIYPAELKRLAHQLETIHNFMAEMERAPTFNPKNEY